MNAYKSFNKRFKAKMLETTYIEHVSHSGAIGIDKINHSNFKNNLNEHINTIQRKTKNNTYKFTTYKQKLISKGPDSKPRIISIPTIRDRLTLRTLCDILFETYSDIIDLKIPQICINNIKSDLANFDGFIKLDIKSFYNSIPHNKLLKILKKRIRKKEILSLITKAIENGTILSPRKNQLYKNKEVGIPQGLSISNILAEIYMLNFDAKISKLDCPLSYHRYVDDVLILCNYKDAELISNILVKELSDKKLKTHPFTDEQSKSHFGKLSQEFSFLGYLFVNKKTSVGAGTIYKFEASIVRLLTTYKYKEKLERNDTEKSLQILKWRLNLRISGCIFNNTKRGWIFYYTQIDDLKILYTLDDTIKKLLLRFNLKNAIQPKKLSKAYHEITKTDVRNNKYIINFDTCSREEKINILGIYLGTKYKLDKKPDEEINRLFNTRVGQVIKELEEDLQDFS